jgi:hypothetical protein
LQVQPDQKEALSGGSFAAYQLGKFDIAILWLKKYLTLVPDDFRALNRLILAAQAANDDIEVDKDIAKIRDDWKAGKSAELSKQPGFVRDIFSVNGQTIAVFERFAPDMSRLAHIWDFMVMSPEGGRPKTVYYVEYDPTVSQMMKSQGEKTAEAYFFDVDRPDGHASFLQLTHRPTYAEAKTIMRPIIEGKKPPVTSSHH